MTVRINSNSDSRFEDQTDRVTTDPWGGGFMASRIDRNVLEAEKLFFFFFLGFHDYEA